MRENFCFSDQNRKCEEHFAFGTGEKGNRLGRSGNESKFEGTGRLGLGDEAVMENGSRTAHGDPPPTRTPSREQQLSFFLFFTRQ